MMKKGKLAVEYLAIIVLALIILVVLLIFASGIRDKIIAGIKSFIQNVLGRR